MDPTRTVCLLAFSFVVLESGIDYGFSEAATTSGKVK
jgi:hypothetical protein